MKLSDIENSIIGEENLKLLLSNKENFSSKYHPSSSTESSEHDLDTVTLKNREIRTDSGEDTKTEDTSSLCLRLPLEGMESKVKLKNEDLDPEEKLKKNIKGFYDIMKARRCNAAKNREQLCLLESSKEIKLELNLTHMKTSEKVSTISSDSESTVVENLEEKNISGIKFRVRFREEIF